MRGLIGLCLVTPLMLYHKQGFLKSVPKELRLYLFIRACLGAGVLFFFSIALLYVPLSQVIIIRNVYPFMASLFGYLINGEKVNKKEISGLCFCFFGILLFAISKS